MRPTLVSLVVLALVCGTVGFAGGGEKAVSPQKAQTLNTTVTRPVKLNYLLFLPAGYDKSDKRWPLILFLHGAGESGQDLNLVKKHGPPKIVETKKDFPFIVVSPQSPRFGWDVQALGALLDEVMKKHRVDPDRVYLTGLSMGGFGTWELAAAYPEKFAAIVPICGGGTRLWARRLKDVPVWCFHGAKDKVVPLDESQRMVDAVKRAGGEVRFTVYPDAGHDSWTATYDNPEVYEWLLKHSRKR